MTEKKDVFITKTVIIAAAAIGISLCIITLIVQYIVFPNFEFENKEKVKVVILPVSATSPSQGQALGQEGQLAITETPPMVGVIALGMNVQVSGTGNEGLRMRAGAGIDQQTMFLAQDGESFRIIEGPLIQDSLIWWRIQALNDSNKVGWSVQDYMTPN
jgi:ABC-type lipoprotein release transport system permease subunit